ncbi:hypothetical protein ACFLU6_09880 [Acidobacteriota bacterium]
MKAKGLHHRKGDAVDKIIFLVDLAGKKIPGRLSRLGGRLFDPKARARSSSYWASSK